MCIMEVKKEQFDQGLAQTLVGCEVAADLDNSSDVRGIVTNFEKWVFLKSLNEGILCDEFNPVGFGGDGTPLRAELQKVVGKVYSLLY